VLLRSCLGACLGLLLGRGASILSREWSVCFLKAAGARSPSDDSPMARSLFLRRAPFFAAATEIAMINNDPAMAYANDPAMQAFGKDQSPLSRLSTAPEFGRSKEYNATYRNDKYDGVLPEDVPRIIDQQYLIKLTEPIGDTIQFAGGESVTSSNKQMNMATIRVTSVKPGSPAALQGVRIGDEAVMIMTPDEKNFVFETELQGWSDQGYKTPGEKLDWYYKRWFAKFQNEGLEGTECGLQLRAKRVPQPGMEAPDFLATTTLDEEVRLSDLVSLGNRTVLFFKPGPRLKRMANSDQEEFRAFMQYAKTFRQLGVNLVAVSADQPGVTDAQMAYAGVPTQMRKDGSFMGLADPNGQIGALYGSAISFQTIGFGQFDDRKTFLIGPDMKIEKVWPAPKWDGKSLEMQEHAKEVAIACGANITTPDYLPGSLAEMVAITKKR